MKRNILLLTILLLSFLRIDAQTEGAIKDCFMAFKKSFSEKNGKEAYTFIDRKSIDYLDTLLTNIKYGDSLTVCTMDPIDKLFLFCVRSLADNTTLQSMDSKGLFDYLINKDLFGTYDYIETNEITIQSNHAQAKIPDTDPPYYLTFNKENNTWKYYINSVFEPEKEKLKLILADNKTDETYFVISRVEKMTDRSFSHPLWKAPLKK